MEYRDQPQPQWYDNLFEEINIHHQCQECKRTIRTSATIGPNKVEYTRAYWCNNDLCAAPHRIIYKCSKMGEMKIKEITCRGKKVDKNITVQKDKQGD